MSKTYNSKYKYQKSLDNDSNREDEIAKSNGFENPYKKFTNKIRYHLYRELQYEDPEKFNEINNKLTKEYWDYAHMTRGVDGDTHQYNFTRHKKRTRAKGLGKGLTIETRKWRNRFGNIEDRSSRMHALKKAGTKIRRAKDKRDFQYLLSFSID